MSKFYFLPYQIGYLFIFFLVDLIW